MAPDRGANGVGDDTTVQTLSHDDITHEIDRIQISSNTIPSHRSHDPATNEKRSDPFQFGQRYLTETDDVFEYNAWDHVVPDDEYISYSEEQFTKQRATPVNDFDRERFNTHPEKWWDLFYKQKSSTFFKDRKWLVQEFPVLAEVTQANADQKVVLEVGAGAGNTAFPVMRMNQNPDLEVIAVDFSKKAVETMRSSPDYNPEQALGKMRAEVWDVTGEDLPPGMNENSADIVVMIFIFSALNPHQWSQAVHNIWRVLKPGGQVLFRDYGRGDLAQVRFKAGRWMQENFYVRGDGTRVYFFDKDELEQIWSRDGVKVNKPSADKITDDDEVVTTAPFKCLNLDFDRRLIVNRQRRIKMYRCWIQGRFEKPSNEG